MRLRTKVILAALGAVAVTVVITQIVQRSVIRSREVQLIHQTMKLVVTEAEQVRHNASTLFANGAYDLPKLLAELKSQGNLQKSTLYKAIPIVATWTAIETASEREGYEFRVPKRQPRNPANTPTPEEGKILDYLESTKSPEYFHVDSDTKEIVYARPIVLTPDCLTCHGDPKDSVTKDGKDPVGGPMEGWKDGEIHGAFVLKSKFTAVDKVVYAGMLTALMWVLPGAALIGLGFYWLNRRMIIGPLTVAIDHIQASSGQTAIAAHEISTSSHALADGASQQAASLEETGASLEEMASMTRRNAEHAGQANTLARETRQAADAGSVEMQQMSKAMDEIKGSSDNIARIIKTIDEIAFQTNLLALNAAVEAARAGEAGMGFAVVAEEVRSLAQRSAQAAKETEGIIADSIQRSQHGVELSTRVAHSLADIVDRARQLDDLAAHIATASQEQTEGIQQVNQAISEMDKVTQSNAAMAEESAGAAEELNSQTEGLKAAVDELLNLVGEDTGSSGESPSQTLGMARTTHPEPRPVKLPGSAPIVKQTKNRPGAKKGIGPSNTPTTAMSATTGGSSKPDLADSFRDF